MDYQLKPLGKTCAATGEELAPGSVCYSALVEENGQLLRLDYSERGWTGPPKGAIGHWRGVVPAAEEARPKPLDPEALFRCFEQMSEDASPAQDKFRYVLALLLLQKRRLKLDGSRTDGDASYLQFVGSHGEGPYEVRDQQLTSEEIEQLEQGLAAQLAAEWSM